MLKVPFNPLLKFSAHARALLIYNSEASHSACRKRQLLGTFQWQSALVVVDLRVSNLHSQLVRNGLPLFTNPNVIMFAV